MRFNSHFERFEFARSDLRIGGNIRESLPTNNFLGWPGLTRFDSTVNRFEFRLRSATSTRAGFQVFSLLTSAATRIIGAIRHPITPTLQHSASPPFRFDCQRTTPSGPSITGKCRAANSSFSGIASKFPRPTQVCRRRY